MNVTLDANIWVVSLSPSDKRQAICCDLLDEICSNPGITVCSPLLMGVEVFGSIARINRGDYTKINEAKQMMRMIPSHIWLALDNWLTAEASYCATMFRLRGADAVYVATALSNNATLVTFDQEIIDRASTALTVLKPDEWLEMRP